MLTEESAAVKERLRSLPKVDELLHRPVIHALTVRHGRQVVVRACRQAVDRARKRARAGGKPDVSEDDIRAVLEELTCPRLRTLINATGVVLHTNLGRAPMSPAAFQAAVEVATGYSNLEFDLGKGERGSRYDHAAWLLTQMLGTEDALVVNNNAAAVLLVLSALCAGKEAVVSRGELVEIGGGFRIPEVVAQGGARLKEVGTTNRTRLSDYARAVGPDTGALLKIHRSNFAVVGFTQSVEVAELVALGREKGVPVLVDLGTGLLTDLPGRGADEPRVQEAVRAGADLTMFSGDKLLGGPQAGIITGRAPLVAACREHPLCRALRVDKLTLAALEATLRLHHDGREDEVPTVGMLKRTPAQLRPRVEALLQGLGRTMARVEVRDVSARAGGGTLPLWEIPSVALALVWPGVDAGELSARLRSASPPVVARVQEDAVLLDLRTVLPSQDAVLLGVLQTVLSAGPPTGAHGVSSC